MVWGCILKILRSLLFIPADKLKMLDKIGVLLPDAFILDLEDSVSEENKEIARANIASKLASLETKDKIIFVRVNDLDFSYIYKDIDSTLCSKVSGYMIPKFEDTVKLEKITDYIIKKERKLKLNHKVKIILLIESSKGLLELRSLDNLSNKEIYNRVIALALGAEDYLFSLSVFGNISEDMVDYARKEIIIHANAKKLLAIDTVYRDLKDSQGLKEELKKIVALGFNAKLAIHPAQIEIINSAFSPTGEDIERMKIILKYQDDIERDGAISIDGVMYDQPHLKWAKKLKDYLDNIISNIKKGKNSN